MADSVPTVRQLPLTLRFRLGPFPVAVEPTFWLFTLIAFGAHWLSVAWAAVAFVSVLAHELGHALAARRYGSGASIRLHALGGVTTHQQLPLRRQRILVSLAGPGAGFALGLAVLALHLSLPAARPPAIGFIILSLLWVNFGWGVINLLPVPPLDGGHVFAEAVGPRKAMLAAQVGAVVGLIAAVEGFRRGSPFAALMFGFLSFRCFVAWWRLWKERQLQRQLRKHREAMWEEALAEDQVGEAHRAAFRETMRSLREPPPAPAPEPEPDRDPALMARVFEELGVPAPAAERALEAYRRDPSDASALQAVRLLLAAGRRAEAEALVARARWSAEATRAEAAELLRKSTPSPTR